MGKDLFVKAVADLQERFDSYDWSLYDYRHDGITEKMYHWPGDAFEDVMVVVHKSNGVKEEFHRHDFFYFNYTYKGSYESLSQMYNQRITIREGELYAGQPLAGHALFAHDNNDTIVIGVLIKPDSFFRLFMPLLSTDAKMFRFFIDPKTKGVSEEYIHFKPAVSCELRSILEMMVVEYSSGKPDNQPVLRALAICYLSYVIREYTQLHAKKGERQLSDQVVEYLNLHFESATLTGTAQSLGYHPNYLSTMIKNDAGKTFSELLLQIRMERAFTLLKNTALSVNDVSLFLGYSNTSNFYKAFKRYYNTSPRELQSMA